MDAQETRIFTLVVILVVVIGIIIYYFFDSLKRQHRKILELKMQNITSELNSIEKDRSRIASDLHDELSPMLSAIKLKISSFELPDEGDREQQQQTNKHLSEVLQKLRSISYNLMPVTLKRKGLVAAIQEFTNYVSTDDQLKIDFKASKVSLDDERSIHLYRIVQEIIHNTVKHAKATLLQLSLHENDGLVIFSSKDNGNGFDYHRKLQDGGGFGLRNLSSRTDVLEGRLDIQSKPGKGTVYTIEIPTTAYEEKSQRHKDPLG